MAQWLDRRLSGTLPAATPISRNHPHTITCTHRQHRFAVLKVLGGSLAVPVSVIGDTAPEHVNVRTLRPPATAQCLSEEGSVLESLKGVGRDQIGREHVVRKPLEAVARHTGHNERASCQRTRCEAGCRRRPTGACGLTV